MTLALVVLALTAAGWATHVALRSFLIDRVDRELAGPQLQSAARLLSGRAGPPGPGDARRVADLPADSVVELRLCDP